MKILAKILTKDRQRIEKKVPFTASSFRWNKGIYEVDANRVYLVRKKGEIKGLPQSLYREGSSKPIGFKDVEGITSILDQIVINRILEESGRPKGVAFDIIADYLKSPGKLFFLVIIILILVAGLTGILTPRDLGVSP